MTALDEVSILATRGIHYFQKYGTFSVNAHAVHDMLFGATVKPKDPRYFYADLHVHLPASLDMRPVLQDVSKRIDVMAITGRTLDDAFHDHLLFEAAVEKLEQESIEHDVLGKRLVRTYPYGRAHEPLFLVRATEVYPKEMQGIVIVGSEKEPNWYHGKPDLAEVVQAADDMGAFRFFDHPFSISAPAVHFRYPTEDEVKRRIDIFQRYTAVIEVGNLQNTLWMYLSNEIAKDVVRQNDALLVGIANSDTHFNPHDIGLSRTGIPRDFLKVYSEEAFFSSLRRRIRPSWRGYIKVDANYASIWAFSKHMVLPKIREKVGMKNNFSKTI